MNPTTTRTVNGLATAQFHPAGVPVGIVVISHGYAEHAGRYHEVAGVIADAGWVALTYDVRGHGKSVGARGFIESFDQYLADLHAMIALARTLVPAGAPIVLLGHSHGSLITLRALVDGTPPGVVAAILSSPYLGLRLPVPGYKKLLGRVASRIAPGLGQKNGIRSEDLTSDPQKQAEHRADTVNFDIATARWFVESSRAQDDVAANASKIRLPTTWLVGGADPIADPAQSRRVANLVTGATYHDLAGLKHEVFNETTRAQVYDLLRAALAAAA